MYLFRRWATRNARRVSGVHVMAYRQEHLVTEIILESGVLKNRIINPKAAKRSVRSEEFNAAS